MINTEKYKAVLEEELQIVIKELQTVAKIDTDTNLWVATEPEHPEAQADDNVVADNQDDYAINNGIMEQLVISFNKINAALKQIEDGTYGTCSVGGEAIEEARLEAFPAADTCTNHMK
jgi:RNA polymerase-binding transcription factor DksA